MLPAEPLCKGDVGAMRREREGDPEGRFQGCPRPLLQGGSPEATVRGRPVSPVPYLLLTPLWRWVPAPPPPFLGFLLRWAPEALVPCLLDFLAHADPLARPPSPRGG